MTYQVFVTFVVIGSIAWVAKCAKMAMADTTNARAPETAMLRVPLILLWKMLWLSLAALFVIVGFYPISWIQGWCGSSLLCAFVALISALIYQAFARYGTVRTPTFRFHFKRESKSTVTFHFHVAQDSKFRRAKQLREAILCEGSGAIMEIAKRMPESVKDLSTVTPWCADRIQGSAGRTRRDLLKMLQAAFPNAEIVPTTTKLDWFQSFMAMNYGTQKNSWRRRFPEKRWWGRLTASGFTVRLPR